MSELELALTRLGRELAYPETPELVAPVRRRLAEGRRPVAWRRPLMIAVAALLVAVAAVMAVPQARSEILDWLGIGGVTIRYVDELPEAEKRTSDLDLGEPAGLGEARRQVAFDVRVPTLDGLEDPDTFLRSDIGQVSFLYGSEDKPRLLINQLLATGGIEKMVGLGTEVELLLVGGAQAAWLEGAEHVIYIPGVGDEEPRLAGNTLIVERDDNVTVRIEADVSKEEALRIYRSMR
jgi:hypothetical protein